MKNRYILASVAVVSVLFALGGGAITASAEPFPLFTSSDLSVGARGQSVVDLQGILAEQGYLILPAGTRLGYFGPLTKAALMKYQTALRVPSTGYFGPMTRAALFSTFAQNKWVDSLGNLGIGMSGSSAVRGISSTATSTSAFTGSSQSNTPLTPTGYWANGNWYNTLPTTSTSTSQNITGYWYNGSWYSMDSGANPLASGSSSTSSSGAVGLGYWYNGVWTAASSTQGGGYYSSNPGIATGGTR